MIPGGHISTRAVIGAFHSPQSMLNPLLSVEFGGVALNDPSEGLLVKLWELEYDKQSGNFLLSAPGVPVIVVFNRPDVEAVSLAFDRNMNPAVAFVQAGQAKFWWYDTAIGGMVFWETELGAAVSPRLTHDDKRDTQSAISDVILSYIRDGSLCYRQQRERYQIEHVLVSGLGDAARLIGTGINSKLRMQWRVENAIAVAGASVRNKPTLDEIITAECAAVGISEEQIDVSALIEIEVDGYKYARGTTPAEIIGQLGSLYFFDVAQWDGKLHFVRRATSVPVATITLDDLAERDGDPIEETRAQESDLVRKLTLQYLDSTAEHVVNSQTVERRSGTIAAESESVTDAPISFTPDAAKQVADVAIRAAWAESTRYAFNLPESFSYLADTDVVSLEVRPGEFRDVRLIETLKDSGVMQIRAIVHAPWAYTSTATAPDGVGGGRPPPAYVPAHPMVAVMDLPVWDGSSSDRWGVYVAARNARGWVGGNIQHRIDGAAGAYTVALTNNANFFTVTQGIAAEVSAEYPSQQVLAVDSEQLEGEPASITYEDLLQYGNLLAVETVEGWEIIQFQNALEPTDEEGTFYLSGLARGRFKTKPAQIIAGARAVMLDGSVVFAVLPETAYGHTVEVRFVASDWPVADDADWVDVSGYAASSTEWPPTGLTATRDGSNNVTVTWIPRPRLGPEISPRQAYYTDGITEKGFTGYRVAWTGGGTADVARDATTYTIAGAAPGITITVSGINYITGAGPASEGVTA